MPTPEMHAHGPPRNDVRDQLRHPCVSSSYSPGLGSPDVASAWYRTRHGANGFMLSSCRHRGARWCTSSWSSSCAKCPRPTRFRGHSTPVLELPVPPAGKVLNRELRSAGARQRHQSIETNHAAT